MKKWSSICLPKISFLMVSARDDFPYLGRPDLHLFEPTLESFKRQKMTDVEWIVVDACYEERKDYFEGLDLPFKVKHVPAKNVWLDNNLPGVSTQFNKGIIHADGELLFFSVDGFMFGSDFFENVWSRYQEGYFPMAWYFYDTTFSKVLPMEVDPWDTNKEIFDLAYPEKDREAPISYNILGYEGKNVTFEHRYVKAFDGNSRKSFHASWGWWFCCGSVSLDAMLKINGFDQRFDGDSGLLDCDVGSRLELAGYGHRLALFRDIFLVRASTQIGKWHDNFKKNSLTIKCNYALIWISRYFKNYKANINKINDADINWIKTVYCKKLCSIRKECANNHPWQYPFEHKSGPNHPKENFSSKEWYNFWKEHQVIIDLKEERKLRLNGEKHQEGTFI